jgi:hypothetical protein
MNTKQREEAQQCQNTDRHLWPDVSDYAYADSIHVTKDGAIGIQCGGLVIVKPLREWHALSRQPGGEPVAWVRWGDSDSGPFASIDWDQKAIQKYPDNTALCAVISKVPTVGDSFTVKNESDVPIRVEIGRQATIRPDMSEAATLSIVKEKLSPAQAPVQGEAERQAVAQTAQYAVEVMVQAYGMIAEGNYEDAQEFLRASAETFTQDIAVAPPRSQADARDALIDLLEVYIVDGQPRFAVHGYPMGEGFETARAAIDAALAAKKGEAT